MAEFARVLLVPLLKRSICLHHQSPFLPLNLTTPSHESSMSSVTVRSQSRVRQVARIRWTHPVARDKFGQEFAATVPEASQGPSVSSCSPVFSAPTRRLGSDVGDLLRLRFCASGRPLDPAALAGGLHSRRVVSGASHLDCPFVCVSAVEWRFGCNNESSRLVPGLFIEQRRSW